MMVIIILCGVVSNPGALTAEVAFNREILPVLASQCFECHGPDKQKAGLRLDVRNIATSERKGESAIVPGNSEASSLINRIRSSDPDHQMPPPESGKSLTPEEITLFEQWIDQGAKYQKHWAFIPPEMPAIPHARDWGHHEIDSFVNRRLQSSGLDPEMPAPRHEFIRRVSLDLTGLPPTYQEVNDFLNDSSGEAHQKLVDRLLRSSSFGERWAAWWLDGARYGDSHGYDNDLENSQWPWRNWVIEMFNANQPFDQFSIEQIAGDLIPGATESQILATGFNRNHRIQTEGGAIDEEWRTEYVMDRVETMGSVWLGLTLSCARCHDHKYDPITQNDFYQLFALFNNLDEKGFINNLRGSAEPRIRYKNSQYLEEKEKILASEPDEKNRELRIKALDSQFPFVMIMREMEERRQSFVLERGQYDVKRDEVEPGLPEYFVTASQSGPVTRMDLAQWIVDPKNPLTSRVIVNRVWEQLFGMALAPNSENLGVQTAWPSHPDLLDWLASDFTQSGWDFKRLIRQIVLSATYRQSHRVTPDKLKMDPANSLISRGPRTRLTAEMVRDQALHLSGLLVDRIGGPSWWVYQPGGLWKEIEKRGTFVQDHGDKLYRRSLYSRIRRTVAPPSMVLFDLPSREVCVVKRASTNTPLQSLALMNEVTYVEAARKFAERIINYPGSTEDQLTWAFKSATSRVPDKMELSILMDGYSRRLEYFSARPELAGALLKNGESPVAHDGNQVELATMTTVANLILNLDELINK